MPAISFRRYLQGSTALCLMLPAALATAQEADDTFLGTIVLGEGKREVQTDTATPVTEIDQEEIDDRQAGTIAELIDSVPGVNLVNGSTPQGSGINIRGFGANSTFGTDQKVAVIVDGANVGAEEIYRIGTQLFTDPELYRSVSVIRGTVGSFEFGSGVVGGVVRLETKDASDFTGGELGVRLRLLVQYNSNGDGLVSATTLAWQPLLNVELLASFTWRDQDVQEDGDGRAIGNSAFTLPSGLLKAKYSFGDDLQHAFTGSYSETRTSETDVPYDTFLTSDATFGNVDRDVRSRTATFRYTFNPVDNDLVNLDVTLSYADQKINQEYVPGSSSCEGGPPFPCGFPFPPGGFSVVNADHRFETTKLAVKNTAFFQTGIIFHDLRAGLEFIRRERLDAASAPGGVDNRIAAFVVDDMQIGDAWTVSPAIRYEHSRIEGSTAPNNGTFITDALMGGISIRYAFANGIALFTSAAYTESLPIIDDLGSAALVTTPEKARTFEVGASYDTTDVFSDGDSLALKVNAYTTRLWDITSYTIPGSTTIRPNFVETEGVEFEASYAMSSGFYVDLNANLARGDEGQPSGAVLDWRGTPADGLQLTVGQKFGEMLDLSWEVVAERRKTTNGVDTPGFGISNLRATYIPQTGAFRDTEIRLGVENIFDKSFTPHLSTRPAPGRNIKLSLAKTF